MTQRQKLRSEPRWDQKFQEFHRDNPQVYEWLRENALRLKRAGRRRYSIKTMICVLRFRQDMQTDSKDKFKINDAYTAFYARLLMKQEPELEGFFETRTRRSRN